MSRTLLVVCSVFISGCIIPVGFVPPSPPARRSATEVQASFGRTWDAVIDVFASEVIPIETMERVSGFIVASRSGIPSRSRAEREFARGLADCGHIPAAPNGQKLEYVYPASAKYNVLVRGDSSTSRVQVTARFIAPRSPTESIECSSTGSFEGQIEAQIKALAERNSPTP